MAGTTAGSFKNGGKRAGAGRKKNKPNKASIKRQEQIAASGITPLDLMIKTMRELYYLAKRAVGSERERLLKAAAVEARGAAMFVHPRLAQVTYDGTIGHTHVHVGEEFDFADVRSHRQDMIDVTLDEPDKVH